MKNGHGVVGRLGAASMLCLSLALAGCGQNAPQQPAQEPTTEQKTESTDQKHEQTAEQTPAPDVSVPDGTYEGIEVETDSSMFRADSYTLTAKDGAYTATLTLPGEGFSRLYFGKADQAAQASDEQIYDYSLNDEGKYTFDIPVAALNEELQIAAYGQRRDTWYDHTILFHAPTLS